MKHLWLRGDWRLEILKPQADDSGYDLVLEANAIIRHVQLKASFRGSTVRETSINTALAVKPSGCVVFLWFDKDTLDLGPFAFFGAGAGEPLPDISALKTGRHTRGKKQERPAIRAIPLSKLEKVATIDQIVARLFGS